MADNRFGLFGSTAPPVATFTQQPFASQPSPQQSPTTGMRRFLPKQPAPGGFVYDVQTPVALLDARNLEWGPWAITLDPMYNVTSPWPTNATQAPNNGLQSGGNPRAIVRWGSGASSRTVEFDYPTGGITFIVNTDNIGVSARATIPGTASTAQQDAAVGAWAVPASAQAQPAPLILTLPNDVNAAVVPPFARYLVISPYSHGALAAGVASARFTDAAISGPEWQFQQAFGAGGAGPIRFPVPPLAQRVDISGGPDLWTVFWELSIA